MQQIATLIDDPAWLPIAYGPRRDALVFAYVPREAQRRATFLDPRHLRDAPRSESVPVASLQRAQLRARAQPLHFIFHTAFCCSTLLARALDLPGVSMGLKEPAVLVPFGQPGAREAHAETYDRALDAVLGLLSRPLAPGERQIAKLSNAANMLLPEVLARRPDSKVLLLYSDLDVFLNGALSKGAPGRDFTRYMFTLLHSHAPLIQFDEQKTIGMTDLQMAAQAWLMQLAIFDQIARTFGPSRVRTLKDETFLARKADTLSRLGGFFGLAPPAGGWSEVASSSIFAQHAKHPGDAFNDAARRAELDRTRAAHRREIDAAIAWAQEIAAQTRAPQSLGDTLFDA